MTEQTKEQTVKNYLLETFATKYKDLSAFINQLPVADSLKAIIMNHFDNGFLWTKEAIITANLTPPAAPANEAEIPVAA